MSNNDTNDIDKTFERPEVQTTGMAFSTDPAPGWVSFHSGTLTIIGAVIAFAIFITYMIIDNWVYQFWGRGL